MVQRRTWPKISPHERPNTHTLQALYSIRTQILYIFQITLTVGNVYYHESYNTYPHIIYYGFPWTRTHWTCCPVITGIILHFIFFPRIYKMSPFDFLWFMNRISHVFVTDSFTRRLTKVHIYLYFINKYCNNHKDGGVLEYLNQYSIYFYAILHQENIK